MKKTEGNIYLLKTLSQLILVFILFDTGYITVNSLFKLVRVYHQFFNPQTPS